MYVWLKKRSAKQNHQPSTLCYLRIISKQEHNMKISYAYITATKSEDPSIYRREKRPIVTCNGLLKCNSHSSAKFYDQDLAAVCNFKKIPPELRSTSSCPVCLSRPTNSETKSGFKRRQNKATKKFKKTSHPLELSLNQFNAGKMSGIDKIRQKLIQYT